MSEDEEHAHGKTRVDVLANRVFIQVEGLVYIVLGVLLASSAVLGIGKAGVSLWEAVLSNGAENTLVQTIDRLLFVLMVIEILHTVRVSFRSGTLVAEPFLIVGLIASIRRVLVITLESSQVSQPGKWSPSSQGLFDASMLELVVLGGLILIMVISIFILRMSKHRREPH